MFLLVGAFWLGRISVENRPSEPKNNLPPQKPDNPEPSPGDKKEGRFHYKVILKEGNVNYHVFNGIIEGIPRKDWKVIYVSENHPQIKQLLSEGKLQENKQFTIRYGKADKEEQKLWLFFNEDNKDLEIIEV